MRVRRSSLKASALALVAKRADRYRELLRGENQARDELRQALDVAVEAGARHVELVEATRMSRQTVYNLRGK
jgi:hypothetical protein